MKNTVAKFVLMALLMTITRTFAWPQQRIFEYIKEQADSIEDIETASCFYAIMMTVWDKYKWDAVSTNARYYIHQDKKYAIERYFTDPQYKGDPRWVMGILLRNNSTEERKRALKMYLDYKAVREEE